MPRRFARTTPVSLVLLVVLVTGCSTVVETRIQVPDGPGIDYYESYLKSRLTDGYLVIPRGEAGKQLLRHNLEIQSTLVTISLENIENQKTLGYGDGAKPYQRKYLAFDADGSYTVSRDPSVMVGGAGLDVWALMAGKTLGTEVEYPAIVEAYERRNLSYVRWLNEAFRTAYTRLDSTRLFPDLRY